uniref:DUF4276 family protein n=1 Tax=Candidatus Kentrum sp. LFY TaxID=2126342 RepID=A0A450WAT3_9GAMM|nr:MAG: protein of unknown function (DUF4276) [Candidatus Kentron sp. LFY]
MKSVITIATIVEGHGEVKALPVLLRRLGPWLSPQCHVEIESPIRVHRDRFLKYDEEEYKKEFQRYLQLAASKSGDNGWILILLDADNDCPAQLGPQILERAKIVIPHRPVSVVLANREFEAWFLAAARSLDGKRDFSYTEEPISGPENTRNAKGWLGKHMGSGRKYYEVTDQPAFAAHFDLAMAHRGSRSFRKLCNEWKKRIVRCSPSL